MKLPPLIQKIEAAGLLGRGCGTFPVARKWQAVLEAPAREKYVICNCSESEPGIFKDEFILDRYPEKVIEGIVLAMKTIRAKKGFFYLKPSYYHKFRHKLEVLIGNDQIELFGKSADDYIGGEETALVNNMEGKREEPRLKPPFLSESGLLGRPTLVNNCETFLHVADIDRGVYRQEKFFCFSGDDTHASVFVLPEKLSVKDALLGSGCYPVFPFFVQLGGAMSGQCLRSDQLADYSIHHYTGLVIHRLDKDERELISSWLKFFRAESCGQCVPCREGTYHLYDMYSRVGYDSQTFRDIIYTMQNSSFCALGKMATNAITSYYGNIKKEKIWLVEDKKKCI